MVLTTLKKEIKDLGEGIKMNEIPINVLWEDYALTSYEDIYKPPPPGKGLFKAPKGSLSMGGQFNRIHPQSLGAAITPYDGLDGDRPINSSEISSKLASLLASRMDTAMASRMDTRAITTAGSGSDTPMESRMDTSGPTPGPSPMAID